MSSPSPLGSVGGGRQRRSAVRYTNLEKATSSPILTKPNRMVHFDPSIVEQNMVGVVGGMQGWRKTMEDRHALVPLPALHGAIIAVFDGHRGTDAAVLASELLPKAIVDLLEAQGKEAISNTDAVHSIFYTVDNQLRKSWEERSLRSSRAGSEAPADSTTTASGSDFSQTSNPPSGQSSPQEFSASTLRAPPSHPQSSELSSITGTTAIIGVAIEDTYTFLNVGDSRSYLITRRGSNDATACPDPAALLSDPQADDEQQSQHRPPVALPRGLTATPTSVDHRTTSAAECARIEAAGGCVINGRVNGKLSVTRALGDFDLKPHLLDCATNPVVCTPDIVQLKRTACAPSKTRRGTHQFEDTRDTLPSTDGATTPVFEYDMIVVGCDGVWELQRIEDIAIVVDTKLQSLEHVLNAANPEDEELCAKRVEAALKEALSDILGRCCAPSCDQTGSSLGADNLSLGFLLLRP